MPSIEILTDDNGRVSVDANDLALHMRQQIALLEKQVPEGNVRKSAISVLTTYAEWLESI